MSTSLNPRAAIPEEAVVLSALAFRAKAYWGYPKEWLESPEWRADLAVSEESLRENPTWVVAVEERPVGFCQLGCDGGVWEVVHLWIEPEWMGRGIGRSLINAAIDWCSRTGVSELLAESDPNAEVFYQKIGFKRVGEVPSSIRGRSLPLLRFRMD